MNPQSISDARKLSSTALSKLSKTDLVKLIQSEPATPNKSIDQSRSPVSGDCGINTVLLAEIDKLLDSKFTKLNEIFALKINYIENAVNNITKVNADLQQKVATLERKLAHTENLHRRQNFILKGINEKDNPKTAATRVMNALDIDDKLKDLGTTIITAFRIGKLRDNSSRPRNILVKLNNQEASNLIFALPVPSLTKSILTVIIHRILRNLFLNFVRRLLNGDETILENRPTLSQVNSTSMVW